MVRVVVGGFAAAQVVGAGDEQGSSTFGQYLTLDHVGEECVAFPRRRQLVSVGRTLDRREVDRRVAKQDADALVLGEPPG